MHPSTSSHVRACSHRIAVRECCVRPGGGKVETGDVAVLFVARCFGRSLVYELSVGVAAQR